MGEDGCGRGERPDMAGLAVVRAAWRSNRPDYSRARVGVGDEGVLEPRGRLASSVGWRPPGAARRTTCRVAPSARTSAGQSRESGQSCTRRNSWHDRSPRNPFGKLDKGCPRPVYGRIDSADPATKWMRAVRTLHTRVLEEGQRTEGTFHKWERAGRSGANTRRFYSPRETARWRGRPRPEPAKHQRGFRRSVDPPCRRKLTANSAINQS